MSTGDGLRCPHCGAAVAADPPRTGALRCVAMSEVVPAVVPVVRYNRAEKLIEIYGGGSGHGADDPYWIDRRELTTLDAMLRKLAHVGGKRWGHAPAFLHALAAAIVEAVMDEEAAPS